jgi:O-antigen/teichoic acid export membrane protein
MTWCAAWFIILAAFDVPITIRLSGVGKKDGMRFNKKTFLAILMLCIPVLILSFIDKFASSFPSYVIESKLGLTAVAFFGSIIYFRAAGAQVINPMSAVIAPRMADYLLNKRYADFRGLIRRSTATAFAMGVAGIIIAILFGEWLLTVLYTKEYAQYYELLIMVMVYCLITYMYIFLGTAITCMRVHWIKLPIHIISFIVLATLLYFQRNSLTLYNVMGSMMIAESLVFVLYNISFIVLFNRIKNGQDSSRLLRLVTSKGVS